MSLVRKLRVLNNLTKNYSVPQMSEKLGWKRSTIYQKLNSMAYMHDLVKYANEFGFEVVARDDFGTEIRFTYEDCIADKQRRKARLTKSEK